MLWVGPVLHPGMSGSLSGPMPHACTIKEGWCKQSVGRTCLALALAQCSVPCSTRKSQARAFKCFLEDMQQVLGVWALLVQGHAEHSLADHLGAMPPAARAIKVGEVEA